MISTKGRYALRVLIDISQQEQGQYIPLKEIASRQGISEKYLQQITKELVSAGFLFGVSGKGGGYKLARSPKDIIVGEVLELMEGNLSAVACLSPNAPKCPRESHCQTLPMWMEFDKLVHDFFYSYSIDDLANANTSSIACNSASENSR